MNEVQKAVSTLNDGGVIVYPTETCYGIGCDARDLEAVEKVFNVKQRDRGKKLTCIVSSIKMAERFCNLSEVEKEVCKEFMPGPLTLVAEKKEGRISDQVNDDFAFRISSSEICRSISEGVGGPVVATSANISVRSSSYSVDSISGELVEKVDYVLDKGELSGKKPSTILKIEGQEVEVLREGPVSKEDVRSFILKVVSSER